MPILELKLFQRCTVLTPVWVTFRTFYMPLVSMLHCFTVSETMGIIDTLITDIIKPRSPGDNHSLLDWGVWAIGKSQGSSYFRNHPNSTQFNFSFLPCRKNNPGNHRKANPRIAVYRSKHTWGIVTPSSEKERPSGFRCSEVRMPDKCGKRKSTWSIRGDFVFKKLTQVLTHRDAFCSHHSFQ